MSEEPPPVDHEKFVLLFSKYEGNVRAFVTSLLPNWEGVDEVLQESSLVMWRKFDQFDTTGPESDFLNWAFMIVRFEVMKFRRKKATDRLVFSEDILELIAEEAEQVAARQLERERALQNCIQKLDPRQRSLIRAAYEDGVSIKEAAEKVGRTQTALYQALARIRRNLHRCIELSLESNPGVENG